MDQINALKKKNSKCVRLWTKSTVSKCVMKVHLQFLVLRHLSHFEKKYVNNCKFWNWIFSQYMYDYLTPVNLFYSLYERRWGRGWVLTNRYKSITSTSSQEEGHLTPLFPSKTYDIEQLWVNAQVLKKKYALIQIKYSDIEKNNCLKEIL